MTKGFEEITLKEKEGLKIINLKFNDILDKEDYELFIPQLERVMKGKDKIRILVELEDFKGLTPGALWEETKFTVKHFSDIDRIATVSDKKVEKIISGFLKLFTNAEIRFFNADEKTEANKWLEEI